METKFTWVPFYEELAHKLLDYKNDRRGLKSRIEQAYGKIGVQLPQNGKNATDVDDIDPFSIFGSFNQLIKGEKAHQNRIARIAALKDEFNLSCALPTDFDGVPAYNPLVTWYVAGDCDKADIDVLWELFECALTYSDAKKNEFIECFNKALSVKGCRITKLSGGLYWIASNKFANYDERNRFFLYDDNNLSDEFKKRLPNLKKHENAENYLQYIDVLQDFINSSGGRYNNFREISLEAGICVNYAQKNEDEFREWMKKGGYSDNTIEQYTKVLKKKICQNFDVDLGVQNYNLFLLEDTDEYEPVKSQIMQNTGFVKYNKETSKGTPKAALDAYSRFLGGVEGLCSWTYSPGPGASMWDKFYSEQVMGIGWTGIDDLRNYHSKEEIQTAVKEKYGGDTSHMNDILALWQFANEMKVGDIIFVKTSSDVILGKGKVVSEYFYDSNNYPDYPHLRKVQWTHKGLWHVKKGYYFASKALTDISNNLGMVAHYNALIDGQLYDDELGESQQALQTGKNILFYGVPGCGKSYHINTQCGIDSKDDNCERVVFHPDYTYSDFVGQILPRVREGKITYEFVAGPFTKLLKKAIQNADKHYYLIIEEINRGNAAAIFGDIFQLLDRKDGKSEYEITNWDIAETVYGEGNGDNKVYIPRNMSILATMNTADQNVFTLDTAFQRRWQMEHIPNDFDDTKNKLQCEQKIPGNDGISWGEFAKRVNEKILQSNSVFGSTADKSLGVYFIKPEEFKGEDSQKIFAEKVLKYLWDDAFKMNHDEMFNKNINSLAKALKEYETTDSLKTVFVEGFFSVKESEDGSNQ